MPRSGRALINSGTISASAFAKHHKPAVLKGSRAQKTRMAHMEENTHDEGDAKPGKVGTNHINAHQFQKTGKLPSATAKGGHTPTADHLTQRVLQKRHSPGEAMAKGKGGKIKAPAAAKSTAQSSAPMYEGSTAKPRYY